MVEPNRIAERLLAELWQVRVALGSTEQLGGSDRSNVQRLAVIEGPDDGPRHVILKRPASTVDAAFSADNEDSWVPMYPAFDSQR